MALTRGGWLWKSPDYNGFWGACFSAFKKTKSLSYKAFM
jgi:hypothetical protein